MEKLIIRKKYSERELGIIERAKRMYPNFKDRKIAKVASEAILRETGTERAVGAIANKIWRERTGYVPQPALKKSEPYNDAAKRLLKEREEVNTSVFIKTPDPAPIKSSYAEQVKLISRLILRLPVEERTVLIEKVFIGL